MRISDWSSDVCSSDLASWGQSGVLVVRAAAQKTSEQDTASGNARTAAADTYTPNEIVVTAQKREEKIIDVPIAMTALSSAALDDHKIEGGAAIGSASCRARVCQSVEISGVAASLKKKNKKPTNTKDNT